MSDHTSIVVPHDFTPVADIALQHAMETAKEVGLPIHVLHIVSAGTTAELQGIIDRLDQIIDAQNIEKIQITAHVRHGDIFSEINRFAKEHTAKLIFMGTHGAQGWKHFFGGDALKVVTSSDIPFILVQEKTVKKGGYNVIVAPLDLSVETTSKFFVIAYLASYFSSEVHIVTPSQKDADLNHALEINIEYAKDYFSKKNIVLKTEVLPSEEFDKEVVRHSVAVGADLIAIMNINRTSWKGMFAHSYGQFIISNDALIPTLIVSPSESNQYYSGWF